MTRHPIPSRLASLAWTREDRALVKHVAAAQRLAVAARAEDAARREVIAGRMTDTEALTHYAADAAIGIAVRVEAEAQARPFAAAAVAQIGTTGIQQLERQLRSYGDR
jgi:hypothetical protein